MVRIIVACSLLMSFALPALAQDDFPRVEMAMGYANVGFPSLTDASKTERHSGFAMHSGFNFTKNFGFENYTGFYSLGNNITMISNVFGGKAAWRGGGKIVPYGIAGIGGTYLTSGYSYSGTSFTTRLGVGFDVPINDALSWKFDVSRMSFHVGNWSSSVNFTTGIVFTLMN